ncbi:MAG: hypothetical protein ISQ70_09710, partial [Pirellulales bacterium]|nr:hypothetical protein [Pirellulales bacterium]
MKKTANRPVSRALAKQKTLRRKAAAWRRKAWKGLAGTLLAAGAFGVAGDAHAQMGQSAMAPAGGVVNRAVGAFSNLNQYGPGYLYYGINAADRGLGYNGSYMTLGGYIPYAEDDMGGFWSADLRGHLSVYGGFFSNVGLVRKQMLGGTLLGVGVYWDYDGDLNQYPTGGAMGTETFGQFGHAYHQVGVSGEWLTDWGNLRSNGYIPVGTTAYTVGAPGTVFGQNYLMCAYGLDAALGGADLEVGAYIPALSQWAGMISVGGYALGNANNEWQEGSRMGEAIVPWFGGVYTRIDMTFIENWDFSLQYNNDSYFESTGFARLTYRMGGSRRRTVPDQLEQPMMRNEHMVRAHQTPDVAVNPVNGNPYNVIHVDNSSTVTGNGTAEAPFLTLAEADAAATSAFDMVYVHVGNSATSSSGTYGGTFGFNAPNQYLIGSGGDFILDTANCGPFTIPALSANRPVLSNPGGTSVEINGQGGATVANLAITGSGIGIAAAGNLTSPITGAPTLIDNTLVLGNGTSATQRGVYLSAPTGDINFTDTAVGQTTAGAFRVDGGNANITYQGLIANNINGNGGVPSTLVDINNTTGGTINLAVGGTPAGALQPNAISDLGGQGIVIEANAAATTINMGNVSLTNSINTGILLKNDNATTSISSDAGTGIVKTTAGAAIGIDGGAPNFDYFGTINNAPTAGAGYMAQIFNTTGGRVVIDGPGSASLADSGDGIFISNASNADINISGALLASTGPQALLVDNSGGTFNFSEFNVIGGTSNGILLTDLSGATTTFTDLNMTIPGASAAGFSASNAGTVNVLNASTLTTAAANQPAINIYEDATAPGTTTLNLNFTSVTSANGNVTPAT